MQRARALACLATAVAAVGVSFAQAAELSLDRRVAAQRAIEEVYRRHRIWPQENSASKERLHAAISEAALRQKVEAGLEKSAALEVVWRRPVTASQLQAELDRMARNTRNGAMLRDLFAALGDDPDLIAETLVRDALVDRLVRSFYAYDPRFHGELRRKAEAALSSCDTIDCFRTLAGTYRELTYTKRDSETMGPPPAEDDDVIFVDPEGWDDQIDRLRQAAGSIDETADAFVATWVIASTDSEVTTATQTWAKVPFEVWWKANRGFECAAAPIAKSMRLPAVVHSGCTPNAWTTTSVIPSGRRGHTIVWTGAEMIVWGGLVSGMATNEGNRYDPATDTWSRTSTDASAPQARTLHSAVWTGTEMIVWGGQRTGPVANLNSGARYDPSTDAWSTISAGEGVPASRAGHVAYWTGERMLVWGGGIAVGGRYDPITDTWLPTSSGSNIPEVIEDYSTVWTGTELIVWGGAYKTFPRLELNSGARYNPVTNGWSPSFFGDGVPEPRRGASAVWTGTEMIVWGGEARGIRLNSGGRFDPSTGTWAPTSVGPNVPQARALHTAVWAGNRMVIWGGAPTSTTTVKTGGRYDPATDTWEPTSTSVATALRETPGVWTGSEMIVWGGRTSSSSSGTNFGARYDPVSDSWVATSTGGSIPAGRIMHTAVWTGSEMIVWGGIGPSAMNTGARFLPAIDTWYATSLGSGVPEPRSRHVAVWTGSEMVVWGGGGSVSLHGGRYDPAEDRWTVTSAVGEPPSRSSPAAVWTGNEMIVWGGFAGTTNLNSGGRYAPATDTWTATSFKGEIPSPRYAHTAVWTGSEMLLWGGLGDSDLPDAGGRYDPLADSWKSIPATPALPGGRYGHTAVWTGRDMLVLGGFDNKTYGLRSGGRFDPGAGMWTPMSTPPLGPVYHSAVWTGSEMIEWGGDVGSSPWTSSGLRYDSKLDTWAATPDAGRPTGRRRHSAVWTGTEMIVWGGDQNSQTYFNSMGIYCVASCSRPGGYYQDNDADGRGVPSVSIQACDRPAGFSASAGDCSDTDPSVYAGAPEILDGIDNQCPGDPGYGLVDEVAGDN